MLNTLPVVEESTDFLCPHCGVSAFEVVSAPDASDGCMDNSATLFLKCFGCDFVFKHPLEVMDIDVAETADESEGSLVRN